MGEAPSISFTGAALDRATVLRQRPGWLEQQLGAENARALLVAERGLRVERGEAGSRLALAPPMDVEGDPVLLGLLPADDSPKAGSSGDSLAADRSANERSFGVEAFPALDLAPGAPLFAIDMGEAGAANGLPGELLGLRELAAELPADQLGIAAYAAALLNWHRKHRFCSVCGQPTEPADAGHERHCPACGAHHFPRTDPVVIMRVTRADELLLGHQAAWPERRYSVLAGFVEPGETLEQAVRREVLEESGVEVSDVRYVASQPWPFPSSLMLGFSATAPPGGDPPRTVDNELQDVRWFSRAEVEAAARGESELLLPPPFSIARRLIDGWLAGADT